MSAPTLAARWSSWGPQLRSVLRIVAALSFVQAGTVKLFGFPIGMPPNGGTASFPSQIWIGGFLEVVGGGSGPGPVHASVAFLMSGMMAVAYFQFHFPGGFWPAVNGGTAAAIFCFVWLYISPRGRPVEPGRAEEERVARASRRRCLLPCSFPLRRRRTLLARSSSAFGRSNTG